MTEATQETEIKRINELTTMISTKVNQLSKDFIESHDGLSDRIDEVDNDARRWCDETKALIEASLVPATPDRAELYEALSQAQGQIQAADQTQESEIRNREGKFLYSFKYADLAACLEVCRKPLSDNGLVIIQLPTLGEAEKIRRGQDEYTVHAVQLETILAHKSGQSISRSMEMTPEKPGPQAVGSCITYLRRYMLCAIVGIAQTDDDAFAATTDPEDYERITHEEIDAILALADKLFDDRADFVIQQMVEKTFDVTHVSQIKAGEAGLAITRLKNTDRREKAKAKKGAGNKKSPKPPEETLEREPGSDDE